jgi:elongator complex protein 3
MPGTELFKDYEKGQFKPMSTEDAAKMIAEFKMHVPRYCRIMRVQRDIPTLVTTAGVSRTNLRQYVDKIMKEKNIKCNCIRCREPTPASEIKKPVIFLEEYESSGGREIFISAEDKDRKTIFGFLRLRIPNLPYRPEISKNSAGIRELHVYGAMAELGHEGSVQHRGIGKQLVAEAEKIAHDRYKANKMLVISGIGVREYYKNLGYGREGPYMSKLL